MALNFPGSPTDGQTYVAPNGTTYVYDATNTLWRVQGGDGDNVVFVSATAPVAPTQGKMWWNSDTGAMYIYYIDVDGGQWVPAAATGPAIIAPDQDLSVSSLVASGDVQAASVNGGHAGPSNLIINGAMTVAQRGTSNSSQNASNTYSSDRFLVAVGTSNAVLSHSQESSGGPEGFTYWLKVSPSTADATIDAEDYSTIGQKVEGLNFAHVGYGTSEAKTLTVSFKFKTNKAGTYCMIHRNGAADRNYLHEFTPVADGNWQTITYTVPGDTTGTWATDTSAAWRWELCMANGTTFQSSTVGSWFGGQFFHSSPNQVNFLDSTSNELGITAVQVTATDTALPFQHEDYGTTLRKCQRYYDDVSLQRAVLTYAGNSNYYHRSVYWHQPMRATPTVSFIGNPVDTQPGGVDVSVSSQNVDNQMCRIHTPTGVVGSSWSSIILNGGTISVIADAEL